MGKRAKERNAMTIKVLWHYNVLGKTERNFSGKRSRSLSKVFI
jgi:hypothetical protein